MEAIKTIYNKTKFRSRLEARYAILFDKLFLDWEYEPKSFILKNGFIYCPDFYFPQLKCYAEVKPNAILNQIEIDKILFFELPIVLICGLPLKNAWRLYENPKVIQDYSEVYPCKEGNDWRWWGCCDESDFPMEGNIFEESALEALFYDFFKF